MLGIDPGILLEGQSIHHPVTDILEMHPGLPQEDIGRKREGDLKEGDISTLAPRCKAAQRDVAEADGHQSRPQDPPQEGEAEMQHREPSGNTLRGITLVPQ